MLTGNDACSKDAEKSFDNLDNVRYHAAVELMMMRIFGEG